ncbi:hypothetical protein PF005_g10291 [Phytophthora fragariae]|uniref:Uncharacterized protein n=1 Tax=Phytophthora fragariae TaxID=53985 RepID=A0A6A3Y737_9STRA|nr:hypothetical protein PF003_g40007 [Phytophthora fragariae]KAE8938805.1 hypothetical protein PF009_g11332 [Phytophthora fragariae]KAE9012078.1 hypothetical protein PF011_g9085 [Phytophthora fragariae]KAE9114283.1 hypothetical protein PF007_g10439 [Phytophthora fragariae]KAE9115715.1 hypothetical protein PF010_g9235 [Phytophthora fragariae]
MQRVAVLSHVKASSVPPSRTSSGVRRIPWQGGKISSNKEEALQKFYQRKLRAGDHLTAQQIKAMQATLGVTQDAQKTPKMQHGAHRSHVKVTASGNRTVLKTGRVLGPKLDSKHQVKKASGSTNNSRTSNAKQQAARQPKTVAKMPQKRAETGSSISLEDKLGLPLDALVGGKSKRSSGNMKRR